MGRPSTLTPEIAQLICKAVRAGNTRKDAAAYAGVAYNCFRNWIRKGRRGESPYDSFAADIEKADAGAVVRNVNVIRKAARKNWTAAAWWLERKYPETWSRDSVRIRELERIVCRLEKMLGAPHEDMTHEAV